MSVEDVVELNVYQTSDCNSGCKFCLRNTTGENEYAPDMSVEVLERTFEVFPNIRSACVAGFGEPLMSPTLRDTVEFLLERDIYIGLVTNGRLLLEHIDVVELCDHVSVSLNAAVPEEWVERVGNGDWKAVLDGAHSAVAADGAKVIVSFVIGRSNYLRIPAYLDGAEELGVAEVSLHNLLPPWKLKTGASMPFWDEVIRDTDHRIIDRIGKLVEDHSFDSEYVTLPVPLSTAFVSQCRSPFVSVGVDGRGAISVCRRVAPPSENTSTIWMPEPWEAPRLQKHRRAMEHDYSALPNECWMCFGKGVEG